MSGLPTLQDPDQNKLDDRSQGLAINIDPNDYGHLSHTVNNINHNGILIPNTFYNKSLGVNVTCAQNMTQNMAQNMAQNMSQHQNNVNNLPQLPQITHPNIKLENTVSVSGQNSNNSEGDGSSNSNQNSGTSGIQSLLQENTCNLLDSLSNNIQLQHPLTVTTDQIEATIFDSKIRGG